MRQIPLMSRVQDKKFLVDNQVVANFMKSHFSSEHIERIRSVYISRHEFLNVSGTARIFGDLAYNEKGRCNECRLPSHFGMRRD